MIKSKVAVMRCNDYNEERVYDALKSGVALIGGMGLFVKEGEKILVKPNVLFGAVPEENVTTHPSVLNAMLKLLTEERVQISYGDSPAFGKPLAGLKKSGLFEVAERYSVKLGEFEKGRLVQNPEGLAAKEFYIAQAALDADGIISLCKMKTHKFTTITGAIKNQFGCVAGLNKSAFHVKIPNAANFSKMLVDINNFLKPRLFVMDAVIAMEGNGPSGGDAVKMNCLIISNDPVAMDATFCRMIDLEPSSVPTNFYGMESGLGTYIQDETAYFGEPLENFINRKFKVERKPIHIGGFVESFKSFKNYIIPRPVIDRNKCTKCGTCVDVCPVEGKALNFKNCKKINPPVYNYNKCIRCYCCQETCPYKAISIQKPFLGRLLTGNI